MDVRRFKILIAASIDAFRQSFFEDQRLDHFQPLLFCIFRFHSFLLRPVIPLDGLNDVKKIWLRCFVVSKARLSRQTININLTCKRKRVKNSEVVVDQETILSHAKSCLVDYDIVLGGKNEVETK
jgi:hypothetical protein